MYMCDVCNLVIVLMVGPCFPNFAIMGMLLLFVLFVVTPSPSQKEKIKVNGFKCRFFRCFLETLLVNLTSIHIYFCAILSSH